MKNICDWQYSKYRYKNGRLCPSKDKRELGIASRLIAGEIADFYSDNIPEHSAGELIDLGCGKVPLYGFYEPYIKNATCVDWVNTAHKNPFLDIEWDLNQKLEFAAENSFDTIILSDVLEHIREPEQLIAEMHRILRKGGKILLNVPFYYWAHEAPYDYFRYTQFALKAMFEKAGFEVIVLKSMGGISEVISDITAKFAASYIPFIGNNTAAFIQQTTRILKKTKIAKKIRNRTEMLFPLGFGLVVEKI